MIDSSLVLSGVDFNDLVNVPDRRPLARRPQPPSLWPHPPQVREFMEGGCGVFALVLHEWSGWPIVWFGCAVDLCGVTTEGEVKLGHVTLQNPDSGLYVDAYGHRTAKAIHDSFSIRMYPPKPMSRRTLVRELIFGDRIGPYTRLTWRHAAKLLERHWGLYGYNWKVPADIRFRDKTS